jgi:hypothetical protein
MPPVTRPLIIPGQHQRSGPGRPQPDLRSGLISDPTPDQASRWSGPTGRKPSKTTTKPLQPDRRLRNGCWRGLTPRMPKMASQRREGPCTIQSVWTRTSIRRRAECARLARPFRSRSRRRARALAANKVGWHRQAEAATRDVRLGQGRSSLNGGSPAGGIGFGRDWGHRLLVRLIAR